MKKVMIIALSLVAFAACTDQKKEIVGNWIEVMPADLNFTQGMTLNSDGTASSIGMETLKYSQWSLNGESLILHGKSIGNGQTIDFVDTMKIVKLSADSLILNTAKYYNGGLQN